MTFIDTGRLYSAGGALDGLCTALRACQDGVASVQSSLSAVAELEELRSTLGTAARSIDGQLRACRRLYQSIDGICRAYASCEGGIMDYCENGVVRYEPPPAEFFDLSSAIDLLDELSFTTDGGETGWNQAVLK